MTAEEFAGIDREESTGQLLTDGDIVSLVNRDDAPELDDNDDCDADDSEGPSEITIKDARQCLATFISFLEQDGSSINDTGDNTETLDFLWKLYNKTNARALRESRQTKLTDFFK